MSRLQTLADYGIVAVLPFSTLGAEGGGDVGNLDQLSCVGRSRRN